MPPSRSSAERKFQVLSRVVSLANAALPLERRLKETVDAVAEGLGADLCAVLLLGQDREGLRVAAISDAGLLREPAGAVPLGGPVEKLLLENPYSGPLLSGLLGGKRPGGEQRLYSWPLRDENFLYGVLCIGGAGRGKPPSDLLSAVARELAAVVRSSRHYEMAKRQVSELNVLFEVGRWIGSTIELDELLKMVVTIIPKIARARSGAIGLVDRASGELRLVSQADGGEVRVFRQTGEADWEGLISELDERLAAAGQEPRACVPLAFKSGLEGRLCVYGLEQPAGGCAELLAGVAGIISSTLENAVIFRQVGELAERHQRMVRLLTTFYEFSQAVMTTVRFEDRQRVILRALTLPQGLRFGRALLMLVDEEEPHALRVRGALAAVPEEEIAREAAGLAECLICPDCLPEVEEFAEARGFEVPLEPGLDVFAHTVLHRKAHLVSDPRRDPLCEAGFLERFGGFPFATVPIKAKGKVIGLLYVDNAPGGQRIEETDLVALEMLANLAGLAIDSALLYEFVESTNYELKQARERLLETEKLAALGELAAGMAHEIRNPLVSIGGFTRRVDRTVDESSPVKPYLAVIIHEVEKLERTLNEILTFSGEGQDHFAPNDLNRIVEEALGLLKREFEETQIEVRREYGELPLVWCDSRQVKHVFFNLFLNARQAMGTAGCLAIHTGYEAGKRPKVWCEVSDTGTGIPPQLLHNIFNPFFTTKDSGSGLGLSIAHKIMTRHQGEISVANKPGVGAAFTVKLPLTQAQSFKEETR